MEPCLKRAWAEIELDHLDQNFRYIRKKIPAQTKILSVLKANAYGCGDAEIAAELAALGTDWFGVATVSEAVSVRAAAPGIPILVFGYTPADSFFLLAEHRITQTVYSVEEALRLNAWAAEHDLRLEVHLELNTGMNRLGFDCCTEEDRRKTLDDCDILFALPRLQITGCYTHLSSAYGFAGEDIAFTKEQLRLFQRMIALLRSRGQDPGLCHCATSAICINDPDFAMDMVRPGCALYGEIPEECYLEPTEFAPVLSLKATVTQVKWMAPNQPVSYDRTYYTPAARRIAVIAAGFADGVQRRAGNTGKVLIGGVPCPIVGTVCMDLVMADVTDAPQVVPGSVATFVGTDGAHTITFNDLEETVRCGLTEAMCGIGARPERIYLRGGKPLFFTRTRRERIPL